MKIGLIGTNGAGKSAACDLLKEFGFNPISLSDEVRTELDRLGLDHSRDNLVSTANSLKQAHRADIFAKRVLATVSKRKWNLVVFDSIRHPLEVKTLQYAGVRMIGIDAPIDLRYSRVMARNRASDAIDFETFKAHDERENSGQSSGQHINACLAMCETIVQNDGSLDELREALRRTVGSWVA